MDHITKFDLLTLLARGEAARSNLSPTVDTSCDPWRVELNNEKLLFHPTTKQIAHIGTKDLQTHPLLRSNSLIFFRSRGDTVPRKDEC